MNANTPQGDFAIQIGGAELLDRVEPLWLQLRRHHAELSPRWSASLLGTSFAQRRADLLAKSAQGLLILLAADDRDDIGYCVSSIADAKGEVDSFFVAPTHRRRGVGHALMSQTMSWFADQAIQSIVVDVLSGNDVAQRFYAGYGFAPRTTRMARTGDSLHVTSKDRAGGEEKAT